MQTHRPGDSDEALRASPIVPISVGIAEATARTEGQVVDDLPADVAVGTEDVILDISGRVDGIIDGFTDWAYG